MCTYPECGCCCDYGRECCPDCRSGNADHLGERGGCKRISPCRIPAELRIGPVRECGRFFCDWWCAFDDWNEIDDETCPFSPAG